MEPDDKNTIVLTNSDGTTTTFNLNNIIDTSGDITIDLNQTYGATTSYTYDPSSYTMVAGAADSSYTISTGIDTISIDNIFSDFNKDMLSAKEVERMCKEYPALDKVWRNFKSVYDMVKQDYEGKKKAGELDDDIPF